MSRHEADREDLMREATAFVRRLELAASHEPEPVVIGFKRSGAWSIYFGADPVYQFDSRHRLRRAFAGGSLLRTQGSTLARLHRERTETETQLVRRDLTPNELHDFLAAARQRLSDLVAAWDANTVRCLRLEPMTELIEPIVRQNLQSLLATGIELAPVIAGKK